MENPEPSAPDPGAKPKPPRSAGDWRTLLLVSALSLTLLLAWYTSSFAIALGHYGWTLFVGLPYCLGFFTAGALRLDGVKRFRTCLGAAFCAALFLGLSFLAMGKEGGICLVMVLPIALPLIFLGASTGYLLFHKPVVVSAGPAALLLVLGLGLTLWAEGPLSRVSPTYAVTDSVAIHAPLPVVWSSLLTMGPLGQPADLLFRLGVACPQRVDIYGTGVGAMRVCTLTTGQLAERITVWRPLHELAWVSLSTPPPLQEWNPFQKTDPPHLHGYYRSVSGRFELSAPPVPRRLLADLV
jgi:hypothetical protein